mgnify:FL=1
MDLNNLILFLILIAFNFFYYNYFLSILNKYNAKFLIDDQFGKPQAFHESAISIAGGLGLFLSLIIILCNFFLYKKVIFFEYLSICTIFFLLGFLDDIKINVKATIRLCLMIIL